MLTQTTQTPAGRLLTCLSPHVVTPRRTTAEGRRGVRSSTKALIASKGTEGGAAVVTVSVRTVCVRVRVDKNVCTARRESERECVCACGLVCIHVRKMWVVAVQRHTHRPRQRESHCLLHHQSQTRSVPEMPSRLQMEILLSGENAKLSAMGIARGRESVCVRVCVV